MNPTTQPHNANAWPTTNDKDHVALAKIHELRQAATIDTTQTLLPIESVVTLPSLYQPRRAESERLISELRRRMRSEEHLDPVLVIPAADKAIIIDGHHRYTAATMEKRNLIAVRWYEGETHKSLLDACAENRKLSLTMSAAERVNHAWRTLRAQAQASEDQRLSLKEIAQATATHRNTLSTMNKVLTTFEEKNLPADLFPKWSDAKNRAERIWAGIKGVEEDNRNIPAEGELWELAEDYANNITKHIPPKLLGNPELFAMVLKTLTGREANQLAIHLWDTVMEDDYFNEWRDELLSRDEDTQSAVGMDDLQEELEELQDRMCTHRAVRSTMKGQGAEARREMQKRLDQLTEPSEIPF